MVIKIIDPHLHLFDLSRGDYHWLKPENPPFWPDKSVIHKDFTITEITSSFNGEANHSTKNDKLELAGFVHIEAGFDNNTPWRELSYIEALLDESHNTALCTIASIDLLNSPSEFKGSLQKLQTYSSFMGVRHILDEDALTVLSNDYAQQNLTTLNNVKGLIFELQLPLSTKETGDINMHNMMSLLMQTIEKNSQLSFIINHAGYPPKSENNEWLTWQNNIAALAKHANVFIKCSGFEMTDRRYTMHWFSQVTQYCIDQFSIERVMLASNFPLCLFSHRSYKEYWQSVLSSSVLKQCSKNEKSALLYDNALRVYKI